MFDKLIGEDLKIEEVLFRVAAFVIEHEKRIEEMEEILYTKQTQENQPHRTTGDLSEDSEIPERQLHPKFSCSMPAADLPTTETVGTRLKLLRTKAKLTQKQVEEKTQINQYTYANYERDAAKPPYENLIKLAKLFNTTTDYIIGKTAIKQKPW